VRRVYDMRAGGCQGAIVGEVAVCRIEACLVWAFSTTAAREREAIGSTVARLEIPDDMTRRQKREFSIFEAEEAAALCWT
jgi:hypothetical protein